MAHTRFMVISAARTGSTHLMRQLCAQPDIWCHGEVWQSGHAFVSRRRPKWTPDEFQPFEAELLALRERDPRAFVERVFAFDNGRPHVGFRLLFGQLPNIAGADILADASIAKIVLFRANVLANYASLRAARETAAWSPWDTAREARPLVQFDPERFVQFWQQYLSDYAALLAELEGSGQSIHVIRYDELNEPIFLSRLLAFLGAGPTVARVRQVAGARGSRDVASRFENARDVEAFLRERDLLHWAHEGDISLRAQ